MINVSPADDLLFAMCDGMWYRGRVVASLVLSAPISYLIHFIDFGNTETVVSTATREIHNCFTVSPAMALRCSSAKEFIHLDNTKLLKTFTGQNLQVINLRIFKLLSFLWPSLQLPETFYIISTFYPFFHFFLLLSLLFQIKIKLVDWFYNLICY